MEPLGREEETYILVEYAFEYTTKEGLPRGSHQAQRAVCPGLKRDLTTTGGTREEEQRQPPLSTSQPKPRPGAAARQVPRRELLSQHLPPTTLLEKADFRVSVGVSQEQPPEYEYRFVSAAPTCELPKPAADEPNHSSRARSASSQARLGVPLGVPRRALPSTSGGLRDSHAGLSASHGCLKPHCPAGPSSSWAGCNWSVEHIRPTVSLDDLARFTPHSHAGAADSGLHKAASWGHPRPLLKSRSESFCQPGEERTEPATKEAATDLCGKQAHLPAGGSTCLRLQLLADIPSRTGHLREGD
uniref:Uncharacterized protein n=1 Tax=Sphaerodactylus townsendi TaxID=933632 RepID=A0ACB8ETP3_9SAUR